MMQLLLRCLLAASLALGLTACDGDSRPFSEAVEVERLNLQLVRITPPANAQDELYLNVGQSIQLGIAGQSASSSSIELSSRDRDWRVSNTAVATVDSHGRLTAKANGPVDVFVLVGGLTSSAFRVTVFDATLTAIEQISGASIGKRCLPEDYYAVGRFSDDTTRTLTNTRWRLANATDSNAVVVRNADASASLTGFNAGTFQLIATQDSVDSQAFEVQIADTLKSILITPNPAAVDKDKTLDLSAQGEYSKDPVNGVAQEGSESKIITEHVSWALSTSGNAAAISNALGSRGVLTGKAAGTETVVVNCGSLQAFRTIRINDPNSSSSAKTLSFNQDNPLLLSRAGSPSVQLRVSTGSTYDADDEIAFSDLTFTVTGISQGTQAISLGDNNSSTAGLIRPQVETGEALVTVTQISTGLTATLTVKVGSS